MQMNMSFDSYSGKNLLIRRSDSIKSSENVRKTVSSDKCFLIDWNEYKLENLSKPDRRSHAHDFINIRRIY